MTVKPTGKKPPNLPAYVLEWVGRRVICTTTSGRRVGLVTQASRVVRERATIYMLHVAIDDGPLWIGPAKAVEVVAERTTKHGDNDAYAN